MVGDWFTLGLRPIGIQLQISQIVLKMGERGMGGVYLCVIKWGGGLLTGLRYTNRLAVTNGTVSLKALVLDMAV